MRCSFLRPVAVGDVHRLKERGAVLFQKGELVLPGALAGVSRLPWPSNFQTAARAQLSQRLAESRVGGRVPVAVVVGVLRGRVVQVHAVDRFGPALLVTDLATDDV